jgi:transposase-like protein
VALTDAVEADAQESARKIVCEGTVGNLQEGPTRCMNELKNRGVEDIIFAVVDGLKGFPDVLWSSPAEQKIGRP